MGLVVGLSGYLQARRGSPSARRFVSGRSSFGLTFHDRVALRSWSCGDRRAELCCTETGTFAMLYEGGRSSASRGVVRQASGVLLWDCITLADIGRFATMADALAAGGGRSQGQVDNVYPIRGRLVHCA